MVTIGSLSDAIIGKIYGNHDEFMLRAARVPDYALCTQCHNPNEMETPSLIFVTDKGKFYGKPSFVGRTNFNILDVLLVDYENQLLYRCNLNYPIVVEPEKDIRLNNYRA